MAVKANPQAAAQAWVSAMQTAGTKYSAGIQAVTTAPGQVAAAQKGKWAANVAAAQDKYAANVGAVSLQAWQADAVNKGAPRLATGATNAQPKMVNFMTKFIPQLQGIVSNLPARGGYDANISRLTTYLNAVHALKGQVV